MSSTTENPDHLAPSKSDFEAVDELLVEVRKLQEEDHCLEASRIWFAAYRMFRKKEQRIGLPTSNDDANAHAYLGILNTLKGLGYTFLSWADELDIRSERLGFSTSDMKSILERLSLDEDMVLKPNTPEKDSEILEFLAS
jgi:hypothetical protein